MSKLNCSIKLTVFMSSDGGWGGGRNRREDHRKGAGVSDAFGINKGLRQGSVLSPLLFIIVLMKYQRRKRLCAEDLTTLRELHEALEQCTKLFKARGLNMSLETTNVLRIGRQRRN